MFVYILLYRRCVFLFRLIPVDNFFFFVIHKQIRYATILMKNLFVFHNTLFGLVFYTRVQIFSILFTNITFAHTFHSCIYLVFVFSSIQHFFIIYVISFFFLYVLTCRRSRTMAARGFHIRKTLFFHPYVRRFVSYKNCFFFLFADGTRLLYSYKFIALEPI